jgi:hypothetical protein
MVKHSGDRRTEPPVSATLMPRLYQDIPEPGSNPYGSMAHILLPLTLRLPGSEEEGDPASPSIRHLLC